GIVPVHELGRRPDGTLYYTMQRIRGRSLTSKLKEATTMEQRLELLIHFRHVCEAMAYAHSRGVVHRDLKPDNVMVGEFGETLIVDWGLAKIRGEDDPRAQEVSRRLRVSELDGAASTIDGHAIGTPAYMSPEQARGDLPQIDERSDVWGLGAMLFELLTGRPPHTGTKAVEVLQKVMDERPPRVRDIVPKAPPELAAIADRALLRDPSSRYPGAEALAAEIRAFQDGAPVHAYEYSSLEMLRRFVGRNRAASVAALVIVLAVVAGTFVSYRAYKSERDLRTLAETRTGAAEQRRDEAERALVDARLAFARSLLEHSEAALAEGDPGAAAIYAAGSLLHDPTNPASPEHVDMPLGEEEAREAAVRSARAFSAYLDAEDARRYVFVRRVEAASARGGLAPDGRTLVFPIGAQLAIEPADGGARRTLPIHADRVLGFLDDDRVILARGDGAGVYSLGSGEQLHALPEGTRAAVRFEDRLAVATEDGTVRVLGVDGYEELGDFQTSVRGETELAWSGETRLVVGGDGRSVLELWPWPPGPRVARTELPAEVHAIAGLDGERRVALGLADPLVAVLSPDPFGVGATLPTLGEVTGAAWLKAGILATAEGTDRVVVRNVDGAQRLDTLHLPRARGHRLESAGRLGLLAALPVRDPDRPVSGSIFRFERHRQRRSRPLDASIHDVRVDGRRRRVLAATLRSLEAFPMTRGGLGDRETIVELPREQGHPTRIAVARDGAIAVVTDLGALLLVEDGEVRVLFEAGHPSPCALGLRFGSHGEQIFVGTVDGSVRRWFRARRRAGDPIPGHQGPVCGLDLTAASSLLVTASTDGTVRLVGPDQGRVEREIERADTTFTDVVVSPDGERIAVGDSAGFVTVYHRSDGSQAARFRAHEGGVERVDWSPDGLHLATAGRDHHVRFGTADGGRIVRLIRTEGPARSVELSSRGSFVYFQDGPTLVRLATSPSIDPRDPARLLRIAEERAGLRLDGLELVPAL
ncbi:MAG: protein kinase, partial [Myxococcales bacterium]|nr:protein kinase [Myxococcales bacterium]